MLGSEGQAVNAKKYRRYSDHLSWGKPLSARFSRAQSATHEALVDAFCFSGATLPNPNATTRIVRPQLNRWVVNISVELWANYAGRGIRVQLNRWVVNISALHVGPRKIFC